MNVNSHYDDFMDVKQVSAYLHLNEKKVYRLVNQGVIPATKVTGKWLFPKALVNQWIFDSSHHGLLHDRLMLAASDDPLLYRLLNDFSASLGNKAIVSCTNTSTRKGLELLQANHVDVCCIHWGPAEESMTRHRSLLQQYKSSSQWILIRAYRREQGLLVNAESFSATADIPSLCKQKKRWDIQQPGSGARCFLLENVSACDLSIDDLNVVSNAFSDRESAAFVNTGHCDIGLGTRATAHEFRLNFISLGWEHLDFVMPRHIWFRHLFQRLINLIDSERSRRIASLLGGYQIKHCGRFLWDAE